MRRRDENGVPFPEHIFAKDDGTPIQPETACRFRSRKSQAPGIYKSFPYLYNYI